MKLILFENFALAAPPRTGTGWFLVACEKAGLKPKANWGATSIFPPNYEGYKVSLVRHPYDWLESMFFSGRSDWIDGVGTNTFDGFVSSSLGRVGSVFDTYKAATVMRLEDFPWNMIEFLESLGLEFNIRLIGEIKPVNARSTVLVTPKITRERVVERDKDFCDRYSYWA